MRQLNVYVNNNKAGVLTEQYLGKGYTFRYDDAYLASEYPAISVTLPKQKKCMSQNIFFPCSQICCPRELIAR